MRYGLFGTEIFYQYRIGLEQSIKRDVFLMKTVEFSAEILKEAENAQK